MPMNIFTLNCFIASVPGDNDAPLNILEDISLLNFPEVTEFLDYGIKKVRNSIVEEIIAKSRS
jgi:hypothetical protein